MQVQMTDRDIVDRVALIVGRGKVRKCAPQKANHKESYQWSISSRSDVMDLMVQLFPYMGTRRQEQIRIALESLYSCG